MSHPQQTTTMPKADVGPTASSAFLTHCYRNALDRLSKSFAKQRAAAIVIGEGKSASRFVIGEFLNTLDEDVVVVRVMQPCEDAVHLMRSIVRAVGFEPKDMGLSDLDSVFRMFLSFQKGHNRRTIICMEEIQDSEWWVLDKIRTLVEIEDEGKFGLMLIISGQPSLKELLHTRPLSSVCLLAGQRISLAPFTLTETTEYLRRRVDTAGGEAVDDVFHYHAITLIHELCAGVPDAIARLVSKCLDLADQEALELVTTDLVKRAYEILRAESEAQQADPHAETVNLSELKPQLGRLIVKISGEEVQEKFLVHGHILIGRGRLCDVRIDSPTVSRQHALISYSPDGAILSDLSSTNGTFVDGYQIKYHKLEPGESIAVGNCRIEYIADDDRQTGYHGADSAKGIQFLPYAK